MEEKDYCALFGVEPEGENEQEIAEPAEEGEQLNGEGANGQEIAEPAAERDP